MGGLRWIVEEAHDTPGRRRSPPSGLSSLDGRWVIRSVARRRQESLRQVLLTFPDIVTLGRAIRRFGWDLEDRGDLDRGKNDPIDGAQDPAFRGSETTGCRARRSREN